MLLLLWPGLCKIELPPFLFTQANSHAQIYGGALTGPDIGQPANDSITRGTCKPVQPQDFELYHVLAAEQVLHSNSSVSELTDMGGRTGFTPIITVAYGEDDSDDPSVVSSCLHMRSRAGFELPFQHANFEDEPRTSGSQSTRVSYKKGTFAFYILLFVYKFLDNLFSHYV